MTIRRFTRAGTAVLLGVAMLAALAGTVSAHNPSATLTCNADHQPQLVITLTNYNATKLNGLYQNTVSASIDGVSVLATTTFADSYSHTFSAGSAYVSHTAQVIVFAWDDPTGSNGWTKTFNLQSGNCQDPTAPPTASPTPTAPPTASPTPTAPPTASPTPTAPPTATPTATPTAFESLKGETATPKQSATPPPTSTGSSGSTDNTTPLFALIISFCLAGSGIYLMAFDARLRGVRP